MQEEEEFERDYYDGRGTITDNENIGLDEPSDTEMMLKFMSQPKSNK